MSIQETIILSRPIAEMRLLAKRAEEQRLEKLTDEEIEDELESTYYNYKIRKEQK